VHEDLIHFEDHFTALTNVRRPGLPRLKCGSMLRFGRYVLVGADGGKLDEKTGQCRLCMFACRAALLGSEGCCQNTAEFFPSFIFLSQFLRPRVIKRNGARYLLTFFFLLVYVCCCRIFCVRARPSRRTRTDIILDQQKSYTHFYDSAKLRSLSLWHLFLT
jgi:hypothetical protein